MILIAICLLLLLGALVYFVVFAGSSGEPEGASAGGGGGDEDKSASYSTSGGGTRPSSSSKTTPAGGGTKVTKDSKDGKTKAGSDSSGKRGHDTTSSKVPKSPPTRSKVPKLPPPKPKPTTPTTTTTSTLPPKIFTCTYAELGVLNIMVPPDGVCDIIFYSHVYYDEYTKSILPQYSLTAYEVILNKTKKYKSTQFGTSMATGNINQSVVYDKANVVKALEALFQKGLVHFGMLNVYNLQDYDALKYGDFKYLTLVAEFLHKKQGDKTRYFCALGAGINDARAPTTYRYLVKKAVTDFPGITMMVLRVHADVIKAVEERYTVGPNPDSLILTKYNTLTLKRIAKGLRSRLEKMMFGRQFYALLSFGMYARAFTMSPKWTREEERTLAWNTTIMDYRLACLMGPPKRDHVDTGSSYSADVANHFLAIFDTTQDCETKRR
ncbi:uncharacterized protein [Dermacentor albipictus]|uniref:uncharacterized protein isoform X2 n=1 Tax=Dermacentor albipictus TaxID=60249 RepID=UPI0038FD132A